MRVKDLTGWEWCMIVWSCMMTDCIMIQHEWYRKWCDVLSLVAKTWSGDVKSNMTWYNMYVLYINCAGMCLGPGYMRSTNRLSTTYTVTISSLQSSEYRFPLDVQMKTYKLVQRKSWYITIHFDITEHQATSVFVVCLPIEPILSFADWMLFFWYATCTINEDEDQTQTDRRRFGWFDWGISKWRPFERGKPRRKNPQNIGAKQIPSFSKMAVSHDWHNLFFLPEFGGSLDHLLNDFVFMKGFKLDTHMLIVNYSKHMLDDVDGRALQLAYYIQYI